MYCIIHKSKERYELEKKLQDLIDSYKITITLHNFLTFHLFVNKKEILLYFQTVKHLQDARIVNITKLSFYNQTRIQTIGFICFLNLIAILYFQDPQSLMYNLLSILPYML